MRSKVLCSAVLTVAALATTAPAAVTYSYVTDTPSVTKNAGESFTVHLYLRETVDGGSASILTAENGLLGAGVRVTRNASAAADPTDLTDINPSTALSGGPGTKDVAAGNAGFSGSVSLSATQGAQPVDLGGGVSQVLLGTLDLVAGLVPGEATTFTIAKLNASNGNTATFTNFYDLDVARASAPAYAAATPSIFTVTVVPEPATLGLALLALPLLGRRRRRRRES
jgi:hypothetical protein